MKDPEVSVRHILEAIERIEEFTEQNKIRFFGRHTSHSAHQLYM
jgi:uncharacterized protein with HEPN domain